MTMSFGKMSINSDGTIKVGGETYIHGSSTTPKNPYWPTKVIHNGKTTIVYFENGDKRVVTCSEEDEFNKEFGFLLALAHEVFGSKDKYRQMYTKKVDKKAYPKFKNNKNIEKINKDKEKYEKATEALEQFKEEWVLKNTEKKMEFVSDLNLTKQEFSEKEIKHIETIVERTIERLNKSNLGL